MLANTHLLFSIPALLCSLKFLLQRHKEDEENMDLEEFGKGPSSHRSVCARNSFVMCVYNGMGARCWGMDLWLLSQALPVILENSLERKQKGDERYQWCPRKAASRRCAAERCGGAAGCVSGSASRGLWLLGLTQFLFWGLPMVQNEGK